MPLNINLFPSHKLNYNDHSIKTFAQHYNCKDHGETSINQLKNLIVCIQSIIGVEAINQVNDIEIVANGIVWSLVKDYDSPRLITVDNKDLSRNELKIIKESEKTLKEHVPLKILYLPNYLKH
ncbi:MAG: hypothetical protein PQ968_10770 [Methanobacterium sp.]|jgi:hypothetical protein